MLPPILYVTFHWLICLTASDLVRCRFSRLVIFWYWYLIQISVELFFLNFYPYLLICILNIPFFSTYLFNFIYTSMYILTYCKSEGLLFSDKQSSDINH
jgi:hypothetical protein